MLDENKIRKIAQGIVNKAKSTARVDQGSLKRSIAFTYVRGEVIFRELYYGQFGSNSKLEEYAINEMPNGVSWKIIYTKFGGGTYEVGRTRQGRKRQSSSLLGALKNTASNLRNLLATVRNGKAKE